MHRYTLDTLTRLKEFARVRTKRSVEVLHGDAGELELPGLFDAVVTSPPYPGLIDYHEQHRYAYELLGLDDLRSREIGAAEQGTSKAAIESYVDGIVRVLASCADVLKPRGRFVIVVNDRRELYPHADAGHEGEERLRPRQGRTQDGVRAPDLGSTRQGDAGA